jgi:putative membrane protein
MKRMTIALWLTIFTVLALSCLSFAEESKPKSIDAVLSAIMTEQGISDPDLINPSKVSQSDLEELGDSVMEAMIGNSEMHERMDARLGGEGSASLKAFHINLGLNYLSDYPYGMINMMRGRMMGYSNAYGNYNWNSYGMMGYWGYTGIAIGALMLLALAIAIVLLARYVFRPKSVATSHDSSMEILRRRYASGEITKEEFDRMSEILEAKN